MEKVPWVREASRKTNAGNCEIDDPSRALFKQALVAAKEAGFQMLGDSIATTHTHTPFRARGTMRDRTGSCGIPCCSPVTTEAARTA